MYPVDLPSLDNSALTSASLKYLSFIETSSDCNEWFQSSPNSKVAITACNIRQLQLFGDDQPDCTLLALYLPDKPKQVVALFLHEKWWHVDDVLTSSKARNGLAMVQSTVERVLVLVLSQLVDRALGEKKPLFSNHPQTESCKLLWTQGEAVGFYSFKPKGSLCKNCISQCYGLPVLDTIFVRSHYRRRGFGLLMLEDFCNMFPTEEVLGISSPLSASMVAVCKRFLLQYKEHRDVLYEVEAPGDWAQRRNIWLNIQLGRYSQCSNDCKGFVFTATSSTTSRKRMTNVGDSSISRDPNPGESPNRGFCQTEHTVPLAQTVDYPLQQSPKTKALKCNVRVSVEEVNIEAKRGRKT